MRDCEGPDGDVSYFSNRWNLTIHIDLKPRCRELFSFDEATDVGT